VPETIDKKRVRAIQLRVAVILKYWIVRQISDFDKKLLEKVMEFLDTLARDGYKDMAKTLQNIIQKKIEEQEERTKLKAAELEFPVANISDNGLSLIDMILGTKSQILAQHLTMIDCYYYYQIEVFLQFELWLTTK
jgi:hypothetical protein